MKPKKFNDSVPYLDIEAVEKNNILQYADTYSTVLATEGDIFVVWDGSRSGLVAKGMIGAVGSTIMRLTPILVNRDYLFYYLKSHYELIQNNTIGASIPHVNPNFFYDLSVPFPPLEEQKRIVEALEIKLSEYQKDFDTAKNELTDIVLYRESIYSQAVNGNLTKDWRNKHYINLNWEKIQLKDIISYVTSGSRDWSKYYNSEGAYFIRTQDIKNNNLDLSETLKVKLPQTIEGKRTLISKFDILLSIVGSNFGKCALVDFVIPEAYVSQNVALIRLTNPEMADFIHLFMISELCQNQLASNVYGNAQPTINLSQIKSIQLKLPSIEEQIEIISRVKSILIDSYEIVSKNLKILNSIENLQLSLLQMAFIGQLSSMFPNDKLIFKPFEDIKTAKKTKQNELEKLKKAQFEINKANKMKLEIEYLKRVVQNNFPDKPFSSEDLISNLEITEKDYDTFRDLLFSTLQEKINENETEQYLESVYDNVENRQLLKIKITFNETIKA